MPPRLHCILDVAEISRLIKEEGADVNQKDVDGTTALHVARSSPVVRVLIENGADVSAKNSRGMYPLHRARNVGVARALLDNGAVVNAIDKFGNSPLHLSNDIDVVKLLLARSASITKRNEKGETPIHMSTYGSKVVALAKAGADIDAVDNVGRTLLMKKSNCLYAFRLLSTLLSLNPAAFLRDADGNTAADFTVNPAVKALLLEYGVEQKWRRRKDLVFMRERPTHFVAKDDLVLRIKGLPVGVFRMVVRYL